MANEQTIVIQCDAEAASLLEREVAGLQGSVQRAERKNLDGSVPVWVLMITAGIQAVPPILETVRKMIADRKVKSVKLPDQPELTNAEQVDIQIRRYRAG